MRAIETLHHLTIREIQKQHQHAVRGIAMNIVQICVLVGGFYAMNVLMHQGSAPLRGNLLLYILTGVFLFQLHIQTAMSGLRAEPPSSPIMAHGGMTALSGILGAGIAALYVQAVSVAALGGAYIALVEPVHIEDPLRLGAIFLLGWASGLCVGMLFFALKVHSPNFASLVSQAYSRVNLLASGQMFVATTLPAYLLHWFTWNPLFHIIDQARDAAFLNYRSWFTNLEFPAISCVAMLAVGILAERWARRISSLSRMSAR